MDSVILLHLHERRHSDEEVTSKSTRVLLLPVLQVGSEAETFVLSLKVTVE